MSRCILPRASKLDEPCTRYAFVNIYAHVYPTPFVDDLIGQFQDNLRRALAGSLIY